MPGGLMSFFNKPPKVKFVLLADGTAEDREQCAKWHFEQWGYVRGQPDIGYSRAVFNETAKNRGTLPLTVVLKIHNKPVAMFSLFKNHYDFLKDESIPVLNCVYIDEKHRGQGLFRLIIKKAEEIARQMGHKKLALFTIDHALNYLYEGSGYVPIRESTFKGHTVWPFEKSLSPSPTARSRSAFNA